MSFDFPGFRPTPPDADEQVAALPRRTAHALHALLACVRDNAQPATAREVMLYDDEATSPLSTAAALRNAARLGFCLIAGSTMSGRNTWAPSISAGDFETALEKRFFADIDYDPNAVHG